MPAKINANVARAICACTLGTFPLIIATIHSQCLKVFFQRNTSTRCKLTSCFCKNWKSVYDLNVFLVLGIKMLSNIEMITAKQIHNK